ncbi:Zinc finger, RanBP2-type [Niveomyces insectorum RCEF 264]|uniref:Zinc finger, RanBP2-type n=1 Tax=Niveomyces insectorum RCEF 264 TaxID=1081102 RepID=A0A167UKY2_9HYPO|nr:Zinc finger, RanBP2-type [Niveomyces insectorum RCEF 264]
MYAYWHHRPAATPVVPGGPEKDPSETLVFANVHPRTRPAAIMEILDRLADLDPNLVSEIRLRNVDVKGRLERHAFVEFFEKTHAAWVYEHISHKLRVRCPPPRFHGIGKVHDGMGHVVRTSRDGRVQRADETSCNGIAVGNEMGISSYPSGSGGSHDRHGYGSGSNSSSGGDSAVNNTGERTSDSHNHGCGKDKKRKSSTEAKKSNKKRKSSGSNSNSNNDGKDNGSVENEDEDGDHNQAGCDDEGNPQGDESNNSENGDDDNEDDDHGDGTKVQYTMPGSNPPTAAEVKGPFYTIVRVDFWTLPVDQANQKRSCRGWQCSECRLPNYLKRGFCYRCGVERPRNERIVYRPLKPPERGED